MERPECFKECGNKAMVVLGGRWLCGKCYIKTDDKIREMKQKELDKIILE